VQKDVGLCLTKSAFLKVVVLCLASALSRSL
jgi:hypothetical protein